MVKEIEKANGSSFSFTDVLENSVIFFLSQICRPNFVLDFQYGQALFRITKSQLMEARNQEK